MKEGRIFWLDFKKDWDDGMVLGRTHVQYFSGLVAIFYGIRRKIDLGLVEENKEKIVFSSKKKHQKKTTTDVKNNQAKVFFWEKSLTNGAILATKNYGLFWLNFWFVLGKDSLQAFL